MARCSVSFVAALGGICPRLPSCKISPAALVNVFQQALRLPSGIFATLMFEPLRERVGSLHLWLSKSALGGMPPMPSPRAATEGC